MDLWGSGNHHLQTPTWAGDGSKWDSRDSLLVSAEAMKLPPYSCSSGRLMTARWNHLEPHDSRLQLSPDSNWVYSV